MPKEPMKPEVTKKLASVTLLTKLNVFGRLTDRLSDTMVGLSLEWDGSKVVVRDEVVKDKEQWLLPSVVASMVWA